MKTCRLRSGFLAGLVCVTTTWAQQQPSIDVQRPTGFILVRPYEAVFVPPVRLHNSLRLQDLIRGGKLYLTVQDAIALALENNIDIETDRYNPLLDAWNLERAQAGGALPGVPSGTSQAGTVASGQGVTGSQAAAGVSSTGGNGTGNNAVGATITQLGPVTPTLDPVIQSTEAYAHKSSPQPDQVQSQVLNLIQNTRNYTESISQGYLYGGQVSLTYRDSYLNENAPSDLLNPSNGVVSQLSFRQNFLQGFGTAVNGRTITVAKANVRINDLTFETEVKGAVANVLNLYYGLVADYDDVRAKQSALEVAQQFFENNKKQVQIGTMAPLDVTTAEAQVASTQQDLVVSQTTLETQQVSLKNVLSRPGLGDSLIANVDIVPLDRIVVPEQDNLPPMKDMMKTAMANRSDLEGEKLNLKNLATTDLGIANTLLPSLGAQANISTQGLSGNPRTVYVQPGTAAGSTGSTAVPPGYVTCPASTGHAGGLCEVANPYFIGNIGTALGQMVRRNFPTQNAGVFLGPTLRNRQAQADYGIDQLSMRQTELQMTKDLNQVAVDISNQSIGLQQARVRYQAAARNRILQQQLLDAEQKKFALGASTTYAVVQQQRDLTAGQSAEVAALVAYSNARVALDQTLGTTLQTSNVSMQEAAKGEVARKSALPDKLPEQPAKATK